MSENAPPPQNFSSRPVATIGPVRRRLPSPTSPPPRRRPRSSSRARSNGSMFSDLNMTSSSSSSSSPSPSPPPRSSRVPFRGAVVRGRTRPAPNGAQQPTARQILTSRQTSPDLPHTPALHEAAPPETPPAEEAPATPPIPAVPQPQEQQILHTAASQAEANPASEGPVRPSFDESVRAPPGQDRDYQYWTNPVSLHGPLFVLRPHNYPPRVAVIQLGDPIYVRSESSVSVNTHRYEPGFLRAELTASVYRVDIRNKTTVFAHVSQLRQRRWENAKPFEISQAEDQEPPEAGRRLLTCDMCDLSDVHDILGLTLFNHFLIIRDQQNREHWVDLNTSSDWSALDQCFASASRRTTFTRSIRIVYVQLTLAKAHMLADRLKQMNRVDSILLPAITDFAHQLEATPFLNSLELFTNLAKISDAPGLEFVPRHLFATFTTAACAIYENTAGRREARFTFEEDYLETVEPGHLTLESAMLYGFLREWNDHDARYRITGLTITVRSLSPWGYTDMTLNELRKLYEWPNVKKVTLFLLIEYQFPDHVLLEQARTARRHEDRITRRYLQVRSAVRTFLRCADKRIKWNVTLLLKLHNIPPGEQAERFATRLRDAVPALERIPNPDFGFDPDILSDDSYANRPPELFGTACHKLRQRLILIQPPNNQPYAHRDDPTAPRDVQFRQALRFQNVYGT